MGGCVNVHATARCLGSCFMKYGGHGWAGVFNVACTCVEEDATLRHATAPPWLYDSFWSV